MGLCVGLLFGCFGFFSIVKTILELSEIVSYAWKDSGSFALVAFELLGQPTVIQDL